MASPNQSTHRLRLLGPGIALIMLSLAYCAYWFVMAGRLEAQLEDWAAAQRAQGYEVAYAQGQMRGFPFRFEYHFDDFSVAAPDHPNQWHWQSEKLVVMAQAYKLSHGIAEATGVQKFSYMEDLRMEARSPQRFFVEGQADTMRASVVIESGDMVRMAADIQSFRGERQGTFLTGPQPIAIERAQLHIRPAPGDNNVMGTDVFIKAEGVSLPPRGTLDVWRQPVELVQVKFHLSGYGQAALKAGDALSAWVTHGGKIMLSDLAFEWQALRFDGEGDVHLDDQARPEGDVQLKISGHGQLIDMLTDMGKLDKRSGKTANTVLTLLAMSSGDPQGRLVAPFKMKDGGLYLGPIRLGDVEPVDLD